MLLNKSKHTKTSQTETRRRIVNPINAKATIANPDINQITEGTPTSVASKIPPTMAKNPAKPNVTFILQPNRTGISPV